MKRFTAISFFLLVSAWSHHSIAQVPNSTGCIPYDRDTVRTALKSYPVSRGDVLPAMFSLKEYCPRAGSQGQLGSCAAWATAYAGLTIVKRIENDDPYYPTFSPYCQYARYKASVMEDECSNGSVIPSHLRQMQSNGCGSLQSHVSACAFEPASRSYGDKLYDFDVLNVSVDNLRNALAQSRPVVISIRSYRYTAWESELNHNESTWNGSYVPGSQDGHHAMCIVGYDDTRSTDGAFLVFNSWGTDWGDNGYFWLRYEDLSHVNEAYSMIPRTVNSSNRWMEPDEDLGQFPIGTSVYGSTLRLINDCIKDVYFAVAYYTGSGWLTQGWYSVESGSSIDLQVGDRLLNPIYWYAESKSSPQLKWYDSREDVSNLFCLRSPEAFTFQNGLYYDVIGEGGDCEKHMAFHKIEPTPGSPLVIHSVSCPDQVSRGGEVTGIPLEKEVIPADTAQTGSNLNWKMNQELRDPASGRSLGALSDGSYEIWYTDGLSEPMNGKFSPNELEKLKAYKFYSRKTAEKWLEYRKNENK